MTFHEIVAVDPGPTESAYVVMDAKTRKPLGFAKVENHALLSLLRDGLADGRHLTIELVRSYGMSVGAEVFDTCVWTGRFAEAGRRGDVTLVPRLNVKKAICHDGHAKDGNIIQALVDRFAPGVGNKGKGSKAAPGFFYGFAGDVWQAYALGVTLADELAGPAF